jgi:hypothetical protein
MFYLEGWKPLVDVVDLVASALQRRYIAEKRGDDVGSDAFYSEVYAEVWQVCNHSTAAIIGPAGGPILLSRKLFTRNSETSQWGDFLCLTLGQIGSCYRQPWIDGLDVEPLEVEDHDPSPFVEPYLSGHVMIRDDEELKAHLKKISKAAPVSGRKPGRPRKWASFEDFYRQLYPDGHRGCTKQEVIDYVHAEGGPCISLSTFDRMIREVRPEM